MDHKACIFVLLVLTNRLLNVIAGLAFENPYTSMDACKSSKVKTEIPEDDFGGKSNSLS